MKVTIKIEGEKCTETYTAEVKDVDIVTEQSGEVSRKGFLTRIVRAGDTERLNLTATGKWKITRKIRV